MEIKQLRESEKVSAAVHFLATVIWGVYGIVIGLVAVVYTYSSDFVWISIIVAVVGNSSHLVAFAWSQKGLTVSSSQGNSSESSISGRQVIDAGGQVIGKIK